MSGIGNGRQIGMEVSICPSLIIIPHRLALIAYQVTQVDILVLFRFMVTLPSAWCQSWNKSKLSPVLHGTLVPPRARSFPSSSAPSYLLGHFWDIQTPGRRPKPPESGHPGHLLLRSTPVTWQSEGHEIVGLETAESKQPCSLAPERPTVRSDELNQSGSWCSHGNTGVRQPSRLHGLRGQGCALTLTRMRRPSSDPWWTLWRVTLQLFGSGLRSFTFSLK